MFIADYDKVMSLHNSIIVAGDLNSKHTNWDCRVNNLNGVRLQNFIANTPYSIAAPNKPTYFPTDINRLPDILDILLLKSIPFVCMQETLAELDSDHAPVKITLNSTSQSYHCNNSLIKGKPNWDIYSNQIKTKLKIPSSIPSLQVAEQTLEHLITVITEAAQACFKPKTHNNSLNIGFIPHFILSLIRQKQIVRRNWQIQRNPATKKLLNQLTKKVKIALQNHRVSSYNNYLSNMHQGDTNLWKASKRLLNQEKNMLKTFFF